MGRSMHGKSDNFRTTFWAIASSNQRELLSTFPAALAGYLLSQGHCVSWLRPDYFDLVHQPRDGPLRKPDSDKIARLFFHAPELCRSPIADAAALLIKRAEDNDRPEKLFILDLSTSLSQAALDLFLAADKRLYLAELDQDSLQHAQCFFNDLMQRLVERGFVQKIRHSAESANDAPLCEQGADSRKQRVPKSHPLRVETLGWYCTGRSRASADDAILRKRLQTSLPGVNLLGIWKTDADFAAWFSILEKFYNQIDPQDGLRLAAHISKRLETTAAIDAKENSAVKVQSDAFPYQLIHQQLVLDLEPK